VNTVATSLDAFYLEQLVPVGESLQEHRKLGVVADVIIFIGIIHVANLVGDGGSLPLCVGPPLR